MPMLPPRRPNRLATLAVGAMLLFPVAAGAQDVPSYAQPVTVSTDETIHGRIVSVDGAFDLRVADDRGFVDSVKLHGGTIINPTGLTLSAGMSVTILGYNAGPVFDANEIDTPYSYSGELPVPVYYGPGYWCPGFAYGYGPSFTLAIVFGDGYRFEHHHFYGRPWDGERYVGGYVGRADGGGTPPYVGNGYRPLPGNERRAFSREPGAGQPPSAFAGRSFAGPPYVGGEPRRLEHGTPAAANGPRSGGPRTFVAPRMPAQSEPAGAPRNNSGSLPRAGYPQARSYPDARSFPQAQSYPQARSFPQAQSYPQARSFPQPQSYPQMRSYPQESGYPRSGGMNATGAIPHTQPVSGGFSRGGMSGAVASPPRAGGVHR